MDYSIVDYTIVSGENDVEIIQRVKELLKQSKNCTEWRPCGSLVIEKDGFMYQPMIKIFIFNS